MHVEAEDGDTDEDEGGKREGDDDVAGHGEESGIMPSMFGSG